MLKYAHVDKLHTFYTQSVVRQGCSISPFIFHFPIEALLQTALTNASSSAVDLLPGGRWANLEYADDIVLFGESAAELQDILSKLS